MSKIITRSTVVVFLKNPLNRWALIKKLKAGQTASGVYEKSDVYDPETDKRHLNILINWRSLSREERSKFIDELVKSPSLAAGMGFGMAKKEELKSKVANVPNNIYSKVKAGAKAAKEVLFGSGKD